MKFYFFQQPKPTFLNGGNLKMCGLQLPGILGSFVNSEFWELKFSCLQTSAVSSDIEYPQGRLSSISPEKTLQSGWPVFRLISAYVINRLRQGPGLLPGINRWPVGNWSTQVAGKQTKLHLLYVESELRMGRHSPCCHCHQRSMEPEKLGNSGLKDRYSIGRRNILSKRNIFLLGQGGSVDRGLNSSLPIHGTR